MKRCYKRFSGCRILPRPGFTLIELTVVVAVIGILTVLVVAAVQASRASAQRLQCSSNLHQIGLALGSYESAHGSLPGGANGSGYSFLVALLPELEYRPTYTSINFAVPADDNSRTSPNFTVFQSVPRAFLCPSDSPRSGTGGTNYAGNRGDGRRLDPDSGVFSIRPSVVVRLRDFSDGTSVTAAVSEWVVGPGQFETRDSLGSVFSTSSGLAGPANLERFVAECHAIDHRRANINNNDKGLNWFLGGYRHAIYNHALDINSPSCVSDGMVQDGAYSAASRHRSGAHTLFADGHTTFQSPSITLPVWRAQGTRSGGEILE